MCRGHLLTAGGWRLCAQGMDCCSDSAISFHYVPPNMMYTIEYLIYHLKPYGVRTRLTAAAPPDSAVIPRGVQFPAAAPQSTAATPDERTTAPQRPPPTSRTAHPPTSSPAPRAEPATGGTRPSGAARARRSVDRPAGRRLLDALSAHLVPV